MKERSADQESAWPVGLSAIQSQHGQADRNVARPDLALAQCIVKQLQAGNVDGADHGLTVMGSVMLGSFY
jgi:hypothetical protein